MARIELRDAKVRLKDGLSGSATIDEATPGATDTDANVITVVLNTETTDLVPLGARFTVNTANNTTVYTVTARTPTGAGPTTNVEFSPAWGANTPANADVMTFQPILLDITIGEGNLTWTETKEYEYLRDRGDLDTVKEGDEQPLEVSLEFVYEHVTSGTGEAVTPVDALKRINGAAEWVSSATDPCEPYALDIEILHCVPCGADEDERVTFPDFRYESLEYDLSAATIAVSGRCNASDPTSTRGDYTSEC